MSITSSDIFDDFERRDKSGYGYRAAAVICAVALAFSAFVFIFLNYLSREEESVIPRFTQALDEGDYTAALGMYREIHDQVVAADPSEAGEIEEQTRTMAQMEEIVSGRLTSIEDLVRYERYSLSATDLSFMNEMGELTSSQISEWLRDLCEEFLLGTIEKPDVIFIFNQMSQVGNISASATPLLREIETIEMARGDVQTAERELADGDYISAVKSYMSVTERYTGFVFDYSSSRIVELKDEMYEPMVAEGEHMLEQMRYYSAETLLSDMAVIFPEDNRINNDLLEATAHTVETTEYNGTVEVICIRQIIADTDYGRSGGLNLTADEFERMLEQLYENDYILVDAESLADLSNDTYLVEQDLVVPVGKKPIILVLENMDMSAYNFGTGLCTRLVINDQGQVCGEYTTPDGQTVTSRSAEAIGVLDAFVEDHYDFSFNGAKGVISICGYESCFGYVISEDEIDDRNLALAAVNRNPVDLTQTDIDANRETVSNIMSTLVDTGWKIASSTYGNINAFDSDMETIVSDTEKWMEQIGSLTDGVHMIVYPGGNYIYGTDPRAEYLKSNGFRIFFGIGSNPYYIYGSNYLYYDRAIINYDTISNFSRLFDPSYILQSDRNAAEEEQEII